MTAISLRLAKGNNVCTGAGDAFCGFWLPRYFVSKDNIEDGEKLSRNGDNGDEFGLAGVDQSIAESFEGQSLSRGKGRHVAGIPLSAENRNC